MILNVLKYLINTRRPLIGGYPRIDKKRRYYVGFDIQKDRPTEYPQVIMPKHGTAITLPSMGRGNNIKKGPGEGYLCWYVLRHRLKGFYDNVALTVNGHRYVPDLAYIDAERGIFIDIENDEPYTFSKKIPTHCLGGKDNERNQDIMKAGWIIVRFSEQQSFEQADRCIRFVYELIHNIDASAEMPRCLKKVKALQAVPCWDYDRARQLAKANHRWSYMKKKPEWRFFYHMI